MKKLSISIFAALAIVLAVFSAFTTKPAFNDYEVWAMMPNSTVGSETGFPLYWGALPNIIQKLYSNLSPLPGMTQQDKLEIFIGDYEEAHDLLHLCSPHSDLLCIMYVCTPIEAVLAVKEGDYDPEQF
jgi:hypothetical protein